MDDAEMLAASDYQFGATAEMSTALQPLADELLEIAARLRDVAKSGGMAGPADPGATNLGLRPNRRHLALARQTYALRRKRASIFGSPELFGEPAWDILLDLFIAHAEGKSVSVSSACIGSAAPATTGLRWLGVLADQGLVLRENDAGRQPPSAGAADPRRHHRNGTILRRV